MVTSRWSYNERIGLAGNDRSNSVDEYLNVSDEAITERLYCTVRVLHSIELHGVRAHTLVSFECNNDINANDKPASDVFVNIKYYEKIVWNVFVMIKMLSCFLCYQE